MSQTLSIAIIVKENQKLTSMLKNLPIADEVVIVVDGSKVQVEQQFKTFPLKNVKCYSRLLNEDFSSQRNFALAKTTGDLVLFIDADEDVSDQLFTEIEFIKTQNNALDGYLAKRVDIFLGNVLRYGETGSIYLLRLAKRNSGVWEGNVHEVWNIKGKIGKLKGTIIHNSHNSISSFIEKINYYSSLRAKELRESRVKVSLISILLYTFGKFFINFFIKKGFLDKERGLIMATGMSLHSFLTRSKLWLMLHEK